MEDSASTIKCNEMENNSFYSSKHFLPRQGNFLIFFLENSNTFIQFQIHLSSKKSLWWKWTIHNDYWKTFSNNIHISSSSSATIIQYNRYTFSIIFFLKTIHFFSSELLIYKPTEVKNRSEQICSYLIILIISSLILLFDVK